MVTCASDVNERMISILKLAITSEQNKLENILKYQSMPHTKMMYKRFHWVVHFTHINSITLSRPSVD